MGLNIFASIFRFLSSFLGSLLIIAGLFFFFGAFVLFPLVIGLILVSLVLFFTRTSAKKMHAFHSAARKKFSRSFTNKLAFRFSNSYFSNHIARSFLFGAVIYRLEYIYIVPAVFFAGLVILSMVVLRNVSLSKILFSALLGTVSGFVGVFISTFFI